MAKLANLDRTAHQSLRVEEKRALAVCKDTTMCTVAFSEIARLVIEYPIVFTKSGGADRFVCVALFGVDPTENLFWRDDRWNSYSMPLNIARQPFFVAVTDTVTGGENAQALVTCIDFGNPAVQGGNGEPLFDASGKETAYLRHKLSLLAELVDGEPRSQEFIEKLSSLDLIRPIQLEFIVPGSEPRKVSGLYSIDEQKLRLLDGATLFELNARGYLHAMHAMLSSLGHLQILEQRSSRLRSSPAS
jgi:hypothetical protein